MGVKAGKDNKTAEGELQGQGSPSFLIMAFSKWMNSQTNRINTSAGPWNAAGGDSVTLLASTALRLIVYAM